MRSSVRPSEFKNRKLKFRPQIHAANTGKQCCVASNSGILFQSQEIKRQQHEVREHRDFLEDCLIKTV